MNTDKQIEHLINSISSLESSLNGLQNHANQLNDLHSHSSFSESVENDLTVDSHFKEIVNTMQTQIIEKTNNTETLIKQLLNPDIIQRKIENMKKMQNTIDHIKNKKRILP